MEITNTSEKEIYKTTTWTHLWAYLESAAPGKNELAYGSTFVEVEAGVTVSHIVAPGTRIQLKTTSASPVSWSVLITPLDMIDDVLNALCGGQ